MLRIIIIKSLNVHVVFIHDLPKRKTFNLQKVSLNCFISGCNFLEDFSLQHKKIQKIGFGETAQNNNRSIT